MKDLIEAVQKVIGTDDPRYAKTVAVLAAIDQRRDFDCVICQRPRKHDRFSSRHGRDRDLAPVCHACERGMGKYYGYGTRHSIPTIRHGAFMDRRHAYQIGALAEALEVEVARQQWAGRNGRS